MSFLQKAREAAEKVAAERQAAQHQAASPPANWGQPAAPATPGDPTAVPDDGPPASGWVQPGGAPADGRAQLAGAAGHAKEAFGFARKGLAGVLEKIDAGTMADIVIKATALQEKTNRALRHKGSPYRIQEISISAALPPSVSFTIGRINDPEDELSTAELEALTDSSALLADAGTTGTLPAEGVELEPTR